MKTNVNNLKSGLTRVVLPLLGVCVIAATAFGVGAYTQSVGQIERNEQDEVLMSRLMDARRSSMVLQCINRGQETEAKRCLKATFADDMRVAELLVKDASPAAAGECKAAMAQMARVEKMHPEYYATGTQPSSSIQLARHVTRQ